jgi:hypothetical protein
MQFLKAHYEKIILSIVLLGLAAAAALMPIKVSKERDLAGERENSIVNRPVTPMKPVDLTTNALILARMEQPARLKYGGEHNIFNPVRWQRRPDGGLLKGSETGVNALKVTQIRPLHLRVTYDGPSGTTDNLRYQISVLKETGKSSRPIPRIAGAKEKNNMFTIQEVIGEPQDPKEVKLVLEGEKDPVVISKEKPLERVIGYAADFHYDPENRNWKDLTTKDELTFGGETYNIVAITENEVTISAKSNKKQTTLEYKPPPK